MTLPSGWNRLYSIAHEEQKIEINTTRHALSDRTLRRIALAIAFVAVAVRCYVSWRTHSVGEDALITLRYAEHIAGGQGYVYNPGEHVFGTTTPLYTLLLALAACLHLPAMTCGILLNIVADGVTCWLLARLLARAPIRHPLASLFAAFWYAFNSTPISISISGMETGLVTCAGMAAVSAYVGGRSRPLYLLGGVLFLLRIDGLLLFGLLAAGLAIRQKRLPWQDMGLCLLVALPWLIFATFYFGSPVPTSLIAKITVYSHVDMMGFNREAFHKQFTLGWPLRIVSLLFACGAMQVMFRFLQRVRKRLIKRKTDSVSSSDGVEILMLPLVWVLLYYGTMLTSHVPAFPWYFLPPWPLVIATAALGGAGIYRRLVGFRPALIRLTCSPVPQCLLTLFGLFGLLHVRSVQQDIARMQRQEDTLRVPMGLWLQAHAAPNERILLEPIGYAGYYSQRRILDMIGLVSPEVLPYYHTSGPLAGIVNGLHPEWLVLRQSERDQLHRQDPALPDSRYDLVQPFPSPAAAAFLIYHVRNATGRN